MTAEATFPTTHNDQPRFIIQSSGPKWKVVARFTFSGTKYIVAHCGGQLRMFVPALNNSAPPGYVDYRPVTRPILPIADSDLTRIYSDFQAFQAAGEPK